MRNLRLIEEKNTIEIVDSESQQTLYRIRKDELPRTRDGNDSEWIMQLLPKTWINTEILYKLAVLIQKKFPSNEISWKDTFFAVEKSKYIDATGEVLVPISNSIIDNVLNKIDLGQRAINDETHKIIKEIVERRISEFGLQ